MDGYHLQELKLVNKEWLITWPAWIAMVVTWHWLTMKQAQKQAYSRIQNLLIANMYYRNDIWDRWYEDSDKLRGWWYL
jgi:phosphoribosylamine--glycine ligase